MIGATLVLTHGLIACGDGSRSESVAKDIVVNDEEPIRIPDPVQQTDPATASTPLAPNPGKFALKDFERRVIELTNAERQKRGLQLLNVDGRLTEQCRRWSSTMASQRRMYHSSMSFSGENVAYNQRNPEAVVRAWMNSPGHRANILRSSFRSIGVSMMNSNGPYWCQQFGSR